MISDVKPKIYRDEIDNMYMYIYIYIYLSELRVIPHIEKRLH